MTAIDGKTLLAWKKQVMDEAAAWARTETLPNHSTREAMIQAYVNGVSQGMNQIITTLKLHGHLDVIQK